MEDEGEVHSGLCRVSDGEGMADYPYRETEKGSVVGKIPETWRVVVDSTDRTTTKRRWSNMEGNPIIDRTRDDIGVTDVSRNEFHSRMTYFLMYLGT